MKCPSRLREEQEALASPSQVRQRPRFMETLKLDSPQGAGWRRINQTPAGYGRTMPPIFARKTERGAECWVLPDESSSNYQGLVHGAFLASLGEQVLFLPLALHERLGAGGGTLTVDFAMQYLAGAALGVPLVGEVECIRETGRLAFIRGTLRQDDEAVMGFTATLRKLKSRTPPGAISENG